MVACSGGMDSTVCLHLLGALQPSLGHTLVVGHVDHGLRANSPADQTFVSGIAATASVEFAAVTLRLTDGADLQNRARNQRYRALKKLAREHGCERIVTAHHADDQAETFLMRASRGAGPGALGGIRWRRGDIVRPLLGVTRADLAGFAAAQGIEYRDDPSNRAQRFERNRMRATVLPALEAARPGAIAGLCRTATNVASAQDAADWWARAALVATGVFAVGEGGTPTVTVPREQLPQTGEVLWPWLACVADRLGAPTPSQASASELARIISANPHPGTHCNILGMTAEFTDEHMCVSARDVAHPQSAD